MTAYPGRKRRSRLLSLFSAACVLLPAVTSQANAQTEVAADVVADTVWNAAGSPYIVRQTVTVSASARLTIEPGVVVKFDGPFGLARVDLRIAGALIAAGTDAQPITFTALRDDAAGGDTNGDGAASAPASTDWGSIDFLTGFDDGASILSHCVLRYGGSYQDGCCARGEKAMLRVYSGSLTIENSEIGYGRYGLWIGPTAAATMRACTVAGNAIDGAQAAGAEALIEECRFEANGRDGLRAGGSRVRVTDSAFAGNSRAPVVRVLGTELELVDSQFTANGRQALGLAGSLNADETLPLMDAGGLPQIPYAVVEDLQVAAGVTWTLDPGVILKFEPPSGLYRFGIRVAGTLLAVGSELDPIIFTSWADDAAGGDTNSDAGASTPASTDWGSIDFVAGCAEAQSVLQHCIVRYGGSFQDGCCARGEKAAVRVLGCSVQIEQCTIAHGRFGIELAAPGGGTLADSTISDNAIDGVVIAAGAPVVRGNLIRGNLRDGVRVGGTAAELSDNRIEGNARFPVTQNLDAAPVYTGNLFADNGRRALGLFGNANGARRLERVTIGGIADIVYGVAETLRVAPGASLTLDPGVILKFEPPSGLARKDLIVEGGLHAAGTEAEPITFTSWADDTAGGDTNADDGTTAPASTDWGSIDFMAGCAEAQSVLRHCIVRYGGSFQDGCCSRGEKAAVRVLGCSVQIEQCTIAHGRYGIELAAPSGATLADSTISDNALDGVVIAAGAPVVHGNLIRGNLRDGVRAGGTAAELSDNRIEGNARFPVTQNLDAAPAYAGNLLADNGRRALGLFGNATGARRLERVTIGGIAEIVYGAAETLRVAPGGSLTLDPGVILKFEPPSGLARKDLIVEGALHAAGTEAEPIIFTSWADDTAGGDTNADDGATAPASTDWGSIDFTASADAGASLLEHCSVRFGGSYQNGCCARGDKAALRFFDVSPTLRYTEISFGRHGIECSGAARPLLEHVSIHDNALDGLIASGTAAPILRFGSLAGNGGWGARSLSSNPIEIVWSNILDNAAGGASQGQAGAVLNAVSNWWGAASGPADASAGPPDHNPDGTGNAVSDEVAYRPWSERPYEFVPPAPDPAEWAQPPHAVGTDAIAMAAAAAADAENEPVQYAFERAFGPGTGGRDWDPDRAHTETGLAPNTQYGFVAQARDSAPLPNATAPSAEVRVYTLASPPDGLALVAAGPNWLELRATGAFPNLDAGQSALQIENVNTGTFSGWRQDAAPWRQEGLVPATSYTFIARMRNGDGILTGPSQTLAAATLAMAPAPAPFSNPTLTSVQANWQPAGNPDGTEYFCENSNTGAGSGWITASSWHSTGLNHSSAYTFRVKARNPAGAETSWTSLGTAATLDGTSPAPDPATWAERPQAISSASLRMAATLGTDASPPVRYFFLLASGDAAGASSGWQASDIYLATGLTPNTAYEWRAKMADSAASANETAYSELGRAMTWAAAPVPDAYRDVTETAITAAWLANGNPPGTEYLCRNDVTGEESSWITGTAWVDAGLEPATTYRFRVKARNGEGVETVRVDLGEVATAGAEAPEISAITYDRGAGTVTIAWDAVPGTAYRVEYADSPTGPWQQVPGVITAAGATASWVDSGPPSTPALPGAADARYYRVLMQ